MHGLYKHYSSSAVEHVIAMWQAYLFKGICASGQTVNSRKFILDKYIDMLDLYPHRCNYICDIYVASGGTFVTGTYMAIVWDIRKPASSGNLRLYLRLQVASFVVRFECSIQRAVLCILHTKYSCISSYIHTNACMYEYVHVHTYIYRHTCICISPYTHIYIYIYIYIYMCVYVCMFACICMYIVCACMYT